MTCGNAKNGYIDRVDVRIRDAKDYHKKNIEPYYNKKKL